VTYTRSTAKLPPSGAWPCGAAPLVSVNEAAGHGRGAERLDLLVADAVRWLPARERRRGPQRRAGRSPPALREGSLRAHQCSCCRWMRRASGVADKLVHSCADRLGLRIRDDHVARGPQQLARDTRSQLHRITPPVPPHQHAYSGRLGGVHPRGQLVVRTQPQQMESDSHHRRHPARHPHLHERLRQVHIVGPDGESDRRLGHQWPVALDNVIDEPARLDAVVAVARLVKAEDALLRGRGLTTTGARPRLRLAHEQEHPFAGLERREPVAQPHSPAASRRSKSSRAGSSLTFMPVSLQDASARRQYQRRPGSLHAPPRIAVAPQGRQLRIRIGPPSGRGPRQQRPFDRTLWVAAPFRACDELVRQGPEAGGATDAVRPR